MGLEGVDYAWDRPNLDTLWSQGKRFVCRYLAYLPNGKVLQKAELNNLHSKGFGVLLNWEQAAGDMFAGFTRGQTHAREALRQANVLGAPEWVPIYFSCDKDVTTTAQMNAVASYLDGAASVLGKNRVGVYGEYSVIEALVPNHAQWGWQTYAWSGGKNSGKAHVKQYRNGVQLAGADLDLNVSLKDNFGAWFPASRPGTFGEEDKVELNDQFEIKRWLDDPRLPVNGPGGGEMSDVKTALGFAQQAAYLAYQDTEELKGKVAALETKLDAILAKLDAVPAVQPDFHSTSVGKLVIDVEKLTAPE